MHDRFVTGRRFRILNVVTTPPASAWRRPDISISGRRFARELTALIAPPCSRVSLGVG
jgi:putative transposase